MQRRQAASKRTFTIMLALLGSGTFGLFSDLELNFFLKTGLMFLLLWGGGTLLYAGVSLKRLRKHRSSRPSL